MREWAALLRAGWLSALSYRVGMLFSLLGLAATLVPLYFVAEAIQPLAAASIAREGGSYFGFVALGMACMGVVLVAVTALPTAIGGGIGNGTLEAILASPARTPFALAGLVGYEWCWAALKSALLVVGALALGARLEPGGLPVALAAVALLAIAYAGVGLALAAAVLLFRSAGPFTAAVIAASSLLGGVYYSTSVIPSWIRSLSAVVPLTYGLRATRQALLLGAGLETTGRDLLVTGAFALVLGSVGAAALTAALRHARVQGTLGQY